MNEVKELAIDFKQIATDIMPDLTKYVQNLVNTDLLIQVKLRWLNSGKTANGNVLYYKDGHYKKWRQKKYQVAHKDFSVSGAMWRAIKVKSSRAVGASGEIVYGPSDQRSTDIVSGMNDQTKTNILMPSKDEIIVVTELIEQYIAMDIERRLNG